MSDYLHLSKDYVRKNLRPAANGGQVLGPANVNAYLMAYAGGITSEQAEEYMLEANKGLKANLIRFAFAHKHAIKKIPFFRRYILKKKNEMLKGAFGQLGTFRTEPINLEPFINYYYMDFISIAYKELLNRSIDQEGFETFTKLFRNGLTNQAMVYIIATSPEFNHRGLVHNLKEYKKSFHRYQVKSKALRIPILGKCLGVFILDTKLSGLHDHLDWLGNRLEAKANANLGKEEIVKLSKRIERLGMEMATGRKKHLSSIETLVKESATQYGRVLEDLNKTATCLLSHCDEIKSCVERDCAILAGISDEMCRYGQSLESTLKAVNQTSEDLGALPGFIHSQNCQLREIATSALETANLNARIISKVSGDLDSLPSTIHSYGQYYKSIVSGFTGGVTCVIANDFIIGIPSEEWGFAMGLSLNECFESGSERFFYSQLSKGLTVVDIGANVGIYTLLGLRAGCQVYSYEPTPIVYQILRQNIKANGFWTCGRWHAFQYGVFDSCKTSSFSMVEGMSGHNSIFAEDPSNSQITIELVSIDQHLKNVPQIDLVKIDAEGSEFWILQGMRETIGRNPQIKILVEFAPSILKRAEIKPSMFLGLLKELGLSYKGIDESSGKAYDMDSQELLGMESVNLFLYKDSD